MALALLRPEAEQDVAEAAAWYADKSAELGDAFLDEFARAMRELETNPERPPLYYRNFRRVLLRRFPFKIFFQIAGDRVIVFRVLHAARDHQTLIR